MRPRVYVETSVLSYLTALPTRDLVRAAHQQITTEWWAARDAFELFLSAADNLHAGRATHKGGRMKTDPIIDEVRAARDAFARRYNYDIDAICEALRGLAKADGGTRVVLPSRPATSTSVSAAQPAAAADE